MMSQALPDLITEQLSVTTLRDDGHKHDNIADIPVRTADNERPVEATVTPKKARKKRIKPTIVLFQGHFVHATDDKPMVILENMVMGVDQGTILFIEPKENWEKLVDRYHLRRHIATNCVVMTKTEFLMPGWVDAHCSPTSYLNSAIVNQPKYASTSVIEDRVAKQLFKFYSELSLKSGTTTIAYDGSDIESSARVLSNTLEIVPQRAFVGVETSVATDSQDVSLFQLMKVKDMFTFMMNRKVGAILQQTTKLSSSWLLSKLLELQQQYQTMFKVDIGQVDCVKTLQSNGFLTDKTILMSNTTTIEEEDLPLIVEAGAGLVFCPHDCLRCQQFCDLQQLLNTDMVIGLGTGLVCEGNLTMLDVLRAGLLCFKNIHYKRQHAVGQLFKMATLGGAKVLHMDHLVGNFEIGKRFDAYLVATDGDDSPILTFQNDKVEDMVHKFLLYGDKRNVKDVYVSGKKVT